MTDPNATPTPASAIPTLPGGETTANLEQLLAQAAQRAAQAVETNRMRRPIAEPEEDESGESITYVGTGWIRCMIAGRRYRLRRPFFGELRDLRTALEAQTDELTAKRQEAELGANHRGKRRAAVERKMLALQQRMDTEELTDELLAEHGDLVRENTAILNDSTKANRELSAAADDLRIDWFRQVFEKLGVDGVPEQWPSWVADVNVPAEWTAHWRSVPLDPGAK